MAEITRIPLEERLQAARNGCVCQPEYLPALIREWARTPVKAYFGPCKEEMERLYTILGLKPDENPSYWAVAGMICELDESVGETAAELLTAPMRFMQRLYEERRAGQ